MGGEGFARTIPLSETTKFIVDNRGKTAPTAEAGIALIATNCITNEHLYPLYEKIRFVSQETYHTWFRAHPKPGDILLTTKGSQNGAICLVPDPVDFVIAQDMVAIRANEEVIEPLFLFAALRSPDVQRQIKNLDVSDVIPHFKKSDFDKLLLPYPDRHTQNKIGRIYFELSAKIELNQRLNETLEGIARVIFKSWFVDFDPVRAKAEGRDTGLPKHIADLFPDSFVDSELGKIPEGWEVLSLAECVNVARGLSYKGSGLSDSGLPMHNLNSVHEGGGYKYEGIKYYEGEYKPHHVVRAGDLIVANTEQGHFRLLIGYAAIVPERFSGECLFSHHIYRVRPKNSFGFTPDYLCQLLNTSIMHDTVSGYANGTTVNMLPIDGLQSPQIVVPPSVLIRFFDQHAKSIRKRHEEMIDENRTLAALRDTLLPKLISGEIRISEAEKLTEGVNV